VENGTTQTARRAQTRPDVSVVTPVYNGERFLAEAIESVRAQTYTNWEYVIADNCSTDATAAIATHYAGLDPRIRLVRAEQFLPIIPNWNRALRQMAPDTRYCKVLHADDRLLPECLERMVDLMERSPQVGLVGSYVQCDDVVECAGLPLSRSVWDGREICRNTLLGRYYLFGSPSSVLMRGDLVRAKQGGFYNEDNVHADFEACYELLETHDFGFVHQILSYTRRHPHSVSNTHTRFYNPQLVEYLGMMRRYGPKFLDRETFERVHRDMLRNYRRVVARRIVSGRGRSYWAFHKAKLDRLGYRFGARDLAQGLIEECARLALHPREALRLLRNAMPHRRPRPVPAAPKPRATPAGSGQDPFEASGRS
jgi:glycosyltransferase involved in cell wall biosynthesis